MTTLIISAHSDDEVIGVGGTISKLASEGEDIYVLIFKYGADLPGVLTSWPIMDKSKLREERIKEAKRADKYLGVKETMFLGLEGNMKDMWNKTWERKLLDIINEIQPNKIFFHSKFDSHKDHLFVHKVVNDTILKLKDKPELFTYEINMWKMGIGDPKVIYDITKYFKKKMRALRFFKTQLPSILLLEPMIHLKAVRAGKLIGSKYAELFYPI